MPALALAIALAGVACGYQGEPVPVRADRVDLLRLSGEWVGEYQGRESGRRGSVFFRLDAAADTAYGDVVMVPRGWPPVSEEAPEELSRRAVPEPIAIRFVRADGETVSGELAPYEDPDCRCTVRTTFVGRLSGDVIEGTFTSVHRERGTVQGGSWRAVRRAGAVAGGDDPGLKGPTQEELVERGRELFRTRGCDRCHTAGEGPRVGPDLAAAPEHRSFRWIYHMILNPDSMLREDPAARALLSEFRVPMEDRDVRPWEALFLYEYLAAEAERRSPR